MRRGLWALVLPLVLLLLAAACTADEEEPAAAEPEPEDVAEPDPEPDPEPEDDSDEDEIAAFYSGNTVTVVVATSPGGGFDAYARLIAEGLSDHIPGNPTVIVENMPGAGHMVAMNHVYNAAPQDGTVIGNASGGLAFEQLFGSDGVAYDMGELQFIGMPDEPANMVLVARAEAGFTDFAEVMNGEGDPLVIGAASPGSLQTDNATVLRNVLEANVQLVPGYDGTGPMRLAMEQGEIDAFVTSHHTLAAQDAERIESGEWVLLLQYWDEPQQGLGLDDVPTVYDFAADDEQHDLLFYGAGPPRAFVRPYFVHPEVPADRVAALRDAFAAVLNDADFQANAEQAGLEVGHQSGELLDEVYRDLLALPEELVQALQEALAL
jgi:tripartite-type tricarboxylate transporter receptor subunit TctC